MNEQCLLSVHWSIMLCFVYLCYRKNLGRRCAVSCWFSSSLLSSLSSSLSQLSRPEMSVCFFLLKASRTLSSHLEPDLGSCSVSKGTNFVCYLANILIWLVTIFSHLCVEFSEKRFKMCIDLRQCLFNLRWPCAMNRMLKIHLLPDLSHWSCAVSVDTDVTKAYICALVWLGEGGGGGGGSTMN